MKTNDRYVSRGLLRNRTSTRPSRWATVGVCESVCVWGRRLDVCSGILLLVLLVLLLRAALRTLGSVGVGVGGGTFG